MKSHPNYLNFHNIDPSRVEPARIDRAPGFDSVRPGLEDPHQMTADQAASIIKAMGKHLIDSSMPRPDLLDIVDAVAMAVDALRRFERE